MRVLGALPVLGALRVLGASLFAALLLTLAAASPASPGATGDAPVVARAVLFYAPDCPHCRVLIRDGLPPILQRFEGRLELLAVDAAEPSGKQLLQDAVRRFDVPPERRGVPAVVIGDTYLTGTRDITGRLPGLIEQRLREGETSWPPMPGLTQLMSGDQAVVTTPEGLLGATERPDGILDRLARDRWPNTAALVLIAAMAAALVLVSVRLIGRRMGRSRPPAATPAAAAASAAGRRAALAILIAAGLAVSAYLSYAAATGSSVLCASLTGCDVVQQSSWARILGVPVAYLGLAGYATLAGAFVMAVYGRENVAGRAQFVLFGLAFAGTVFSLYLTVLEPFVIGGSCLWCLASASIMTVILLLSAERLGLVGAQTRPAEEGCDTADCRQPPGQSPRPWMDAG